MTWSILKYSPLVELDSHYSAHVPVEPAFSQSQQPSSCWRVFCPHGFWRVTTLFKPWGESALGARRVHSTTPTIPRRNQENPCVQIWDCCSNGGIQSKLLSRQKPHGSTHTARILRSGGFASSP